MSFPFYTGLSFYSGLFYATDASDVASLTRGWHKMEFYTVCCNFFWLFTIVCLTLLYWPAAYTQYIRDRLIPVLRCISIHSYPCYTLKKLVRETWPAQVSCVMQVHPRSCTNFSGIELCSFWLKKLVQENDVHTSQEARQTCKFSVQVSWACVMCITILQQSHRQTQKPDETLLMEQPPGRTADFNSVHRDTRKLIQKSSLWLLAPLMTLV